MMCCDLGSFSTSASCSKSIGGDIVTSKDNPTIEQEIHEPPVKKPELVKAASPHREK
jgi:hypothetical protein